MTKEANDFTLKDQYNNPFNLFESLKKHRYVLLIFYPGDFTPVCTKQLIDYNNNRSKFREFGIYPVAINIGSVDSHCNYSESYKLDIPLLSDPDKSVSRNFNAVNFSGGNKRKLVLIDNEHRILFEHSIFPLFYQKVEKIIENVKIKITSDF